MNSYKSKNIYTNDQKLNLKYKYIEYSEKEKIYSSIHTIFSKWR